MPLNCGDPSGKNDMETLRSRLATPLDFLAQLSSAQKDNLDRIGKKRVFAKNDFVFKAGQNDQNVYVLNRGRVKLFGSSPEGRDVLLWFSLVGEIFGLAECLQEKSRQIYARAAEPCEVLCIAHAPFKAWLAAQPDVALSLMKILTIRMRELGQRFLSLANGNIQMEIAQLLVRLGATYGRSAGQYVHLGIPLTEQDIADMIGSSRQGVSTCLAIMKREGIIDIVKHFLIIKKQDALHKMAKGPDEIVKIERGASRRGWRGTQSVR